jgi:nuclear pore complex protein Nup98-Nup96
LKNLEYYTVPSLPDLKRIEERLPCLCRNDPGFTIAREGYGEIQFLRQTDVSDMDLDDIVRIGVREIGLYEGYTLKPEMGESLNKLAKVKYFNFLRARGGVL